MTDCDHSRRVSTEFGGIGAGLVRRCVECGDIVAEQVAGPIQDVELPAKQTIKRPARVAKAQPTVSSNEPIDVIKAAKARLRWLKKELKGMANLEKEAAKLQRLLNAADGKPVAVVRDLRRSG